MTRQYRVQIASRQKPMEQLTKEWATAAGLMKELMGVANNAAWLVILDAREELRELPNWKQRVSGGMTVAQNFQRAIEAFHAYEKALLWDDEFGYFDLQNMPEHTRKMYGDISNRDYYDFWCAIGGSTYSRTRPFVTSLWNKYRLALEHDGISNADTIAWGMCGIACLNAAVTIYSMSLDMIHEQFHIDLALLRKVFRKFSLTDVEKLWEDACKLAFPKAFSAPMSDTDGQNVEMGIRQIMEQWTDGDKIYDDMEKTLEECGEDVMKTQGFVKKAITEVQQLRKWHDET